MHLAPLIPLRLPQTLRGQQRVALSRMVAGQRCTCTRIPSFLHEDLFDTTGCPRHDLDELPHTFRCARCAEVVPAQHRGNHWCAACEATCVYCGTADAVAWCSLDDPCCEECHGDHVCPHDETCDECRARGEEGA